MSYSIDTQPLVSIGIPTYNRPKHLRMALENIIKQTYTNLEIIISDNCSPNSEVARIAQEFADKDPRIQYFRQPENLGALFNFEFVLKKSSGSYFMWHPDDYQMLDTDYILNLVEEIKNNFLTFPLFVLSHLGEEKSRAFFKEYENLNNSHEYLMAWCSNGAGFPLYGLYNRNMLLESGYTSYFEKSKKWVYFGDDLFLHQVFLDASVKYCSKARFFVESSSSSYFKISKKALLECFIQCSFETVRLYSESALLPKEKEEVLQIIYKRYSDYTLSFFPRLSLFSPYKQFTSFLKKTYDKLSK